MTNDDILGAAGGNGKAKTIEFGNPETDPRLIAKLLTTKANALVELSRNADEDTDPRLVNLAECVGLLLLVQAHAISVQVAAQSGPRIVVPQPRISLK